MITEIIKRNFKIGKFLLYIILSNILAVFVVKPLFYNSNVLTIGTILGLELLFLLTPLLFMFLFPIYLLVHKETTLKKIMDSLGIDILSILYIYIAVQAFIKAIFFPETRVLSFTNLRTVYLLLAVAFGALYAERTKNKKKKDTSNNGSQSEFTNKVQAKVEKATKNIRRTFKRQEYAKIGPDEYNYKTYKPVVMADSRLMFEQYLYHASAHPGTVLTTRREMNAKKEGRIVGAAIYTNAHELRKNKKRINSDYVKRDSASLREADVPGYQFLADRFNKTINGKRIFNWHRTHLIPFRHTLSEGDTIRNLIFAGTAHLNSGNRPHIDYVVENFEAVHGREQRKKDLLMKFRCNIPLVDNETIKEQVDSRKSVFESNYKHINEDKDIVIKGAPPATNYCLADVEEAVDIIIQSNPEDMFTYGNILHYQNETDISPKWVTSVLVNRTKHKVEFQIKLLNDL